MNPFKIGDRVVITGDLKGTEEFYGVNSYMKKLVGDVLIVQGVSGEAVEANNWAWAASDLSFANFSSESE